eukprot:10125289-Heterocapsa_arctica.AAC.1
MVVVGDRGASSSDGASKSAEEGSPQGPAGDIVGWGASNSSSKMFENGGDVGAAASSLGRRLEASELGLNEGSDHVHDHGAE